jgi:glutamyl-tRNA reductase
MKKLLHQPSVQLRQAGELSDKEMIRAARALFGLAKKKD